MNSEIAKNEEIEENKSQGSEEVVEELSQLEDNSQSEETPIKSGGKVLETKRRRRRSSCAGNEDIYGPKKRSGSRSGGKRRKARKGVSKKRT